MIRAMTPAETRKALHHAADVCADTGRICWDALDICVADATCAAATHLLCAGDGPYAETPMQAAIFLDLAAEALGDL